MTMGMSIPTTTPMTTSTDASSQMLELTRWLSPAFPLGSFAYSAGLETEIGAGRIASAGDVTAWLRQILHHGGLRCDAILLVAARTDPDTAAATARALAPTAERWAETIAQGTAFADTVTALGGPAVTPAALPVAVGQAAQRLSALDDATVASHYLQSALAAQVSAAVRFVPLGQTDGQRILAQLAPDARAVAEEAAAGTLADLGSAAIHADLSAAEHETLEVRIFRS